MQKAHVMTSQTSHATPHRILVIGGAGFIGGHVVKSLIDAGLNLAVYDLHAQPSSIDIEWHSGSITDLSLMASVVADRDAVVFLANASLPGSSIASLSMEIQSHVRDTLRVAEVCAELGVKHFVFASSGGTVYGHCPAPGTGLVETALTQPQNAYGVSKLAIEHYLRLLSGKADMRTTSLRISNPYGEGQRAVRGQGFIAAAIQRAMDGSELEIWGDGLVERDFIHVSDVAAAILATLRSDNPPDVVNIGTGQATSLKSIVEMVEAACGTSIDTRYYPGRRIDIERNVLDIARAQNTLDWSPRIVLEDGLTQTVAWWQEHHKPA